MKTLEDYLLARNGEPRAMVAALDVQAGAVFIRLGALGNHPAITLRVEGNSLDITSPAVFVEAHQPTEQHAQAAQTGTDTVQQQVAAAQPAAAPAPAAKPPFGGKGDHDGNGKTGGAKKPTTK